MEEFQDSPGNFELSVWENFNSSFYRVEEVATDTYIGAGQIGLVF